MVPLVRPVGQRQRRIVCTVYDPNGNQLSRSPEALVPAAGPAAYSLGLGLAGMELSR
jgi:hypothetical protein